MTDEGKPPRKEKGPQTDTKGGEKSNKTQQPQEGDKGTKGAQSTQAESQPGPATDEVKPKRERVRPGRGPREKPNTAQQPQEDGNSTEGGPQANTAQQPTKDADSTEAPTSNTVQRPQEATNSAEDPEEVVGQGLGDSRHAPQKRKSRTVKKSEVPGTTEGCGSTEADKVRKPRWRKEGKNLDTAQPSQKDDNSTADAPSIQTGSQPSQPVDQPTQAEEQSTQVEDQSTQAGGQSAQGEDQSTPVEGQSGHSEGQSAGGEKEGPSELSRRQRRRRNQEVRAAERKAKDAEEHQTGPEQPGSPAEVVGLENSRQAPRNNTQLSRPAETYPGLAAGVRSATVRESQQRRLDHAASEHWTPEQREQFRVSQEALGERVKANTVRKEHVAENNTRREAEKEAQKSKRKAEQAKREADNRETARLHAEAPSGPRGNIPQRRPPPPPPPPSTANNPQNGAGRRHGRGPSEGAADPGRIGPPPNVPTGPANNPGRAGPPVNAPTGPANNHQQQRGGHRTYPPSEMMRGVFIDIPRRYQPTSDFTVDQVAGWEMHEARQASLASYHEENRRHPPANNPANNQPQNPYPPLATYPAAYQQPLPYDPNGYDQQQRGQGAPGGYGRSRSEGTDDPVRVRLPVGTPTGPRNQTVNNPQQCGGGNGGGGRGPNHGQGYGNQGGGGDMGGGGGERNWEAGYYDATGHWRLDADLASQRGKL